MSTESEALNSLTPGNIYSVTKEAYTFMNKLVKGNMTSICFARQEGNMMWLKPATKRDKKLILEIFDNCKVPYKQVIES